MTDFSLKINPGAIMKSVESDFIKADLPRFEVGDTVKLSIEIKEGAKERLQYYEGVIISIKNSGLSKTITVRRVLQNIGVERVFLINSPKIKAIEIKRSSKVRRAKLYYLRNLSGKATRLKQKFK
jgi:large subunit ribosomal protein L19|tara:strand:- start:11051 stop:11425 length:375 start_codon:yes stop_codon:yes gene_type:complete